MEKQNLTTGFQNVDNAQHQFLIKFLEDAGAFPSVLEGFEMQLKWLDIKEGYHVLDVGCGIGLQAQSMAKLVGAEGKVAGTDFITQSASTNVASTESVSTKMARTEGRHPISFP